MKTNFTHSIKVNVCFIIFSMLFLAALRSFGQAPPQATPFTIDGRIYYQVMNNQLYQYNQDGSRTLLATYGNSSTHNLNAIGFNPTDSMIWGYNTVSSNFFRIGSGGASEYWEFNVAGVSDPANLFNVGTIDTSGYLYVYQSNTSRYFTVDLNPERPVTFLKAVDPANGTLKTAVPYGTTITARAISDWAYNPLDGYIYTVLEGWAAVGNRFRVLRIDPRTAAEVLFTGEVSGGGFQQPNNGDPWGYGSSFIDNTGDFYLFNNFNGIFYRLTGYAVNGAKTAIVVNNSGITGNQNNDGAFPYAVTYGSAPLPVRWLIFDAEASGKDVTLSWSTATERNNKVFEVERSSDAKRWRTVGSVNSKAEGGNSNGPLYYDLSDLGLASGKHYYRLRQVDHDGAYSYSDVRAVTVTKGTISLYPNPATELVTVSGLSGKAEVAVYDVSGRLVMDASLQPGAYTIDMKRLLEGIYEVVISDATGAVSTFKVHKL